MIKAKVIKPFYYEKDKVLYLDEDTFQELSEKGLIVSCNEKKNDVRIETTQLFAAGKVKIEKAIVNDKRRVLSE